MQTWCVLNILRLKFLNTKKNLAHNLLLFMHSTYHNDLIKSLLQVLLCNAHFRSNLEN